MFRGHGRRITVFGAGVIVAGLAVLLAFVTDGSDAGSAHGTRGSSPGVFTSVLGSRVSDAGVAQTSASQATASSNGGKGRHRRREPSGARDLHRHRSRLDLLSIVKAQMEPTAAALVSEMDMPKVTNGWTVEDHYQTTSIAAGGAPRPSDGMFAIYRARVRPFSIATDLVKVPGSGTVTITKAPLGRGVATSAQDRGEFEFKGETGVTGTLHLKDDTVTLNP